MSDLKNMIQALMQNGDPMPFGVGAPSEPAVAAPQFVIDSINSAVTLPKRAIENSAHSWATGTYDPSVPMEAAMTLAGGGLPMAERGAVGMFGGRLSPAADLRALREAEAMRAGGKHSDDIWHDTNWANYPTDNKWRFEIPDNKMFLKYMPMGEGERAISSVQSMVHHPEAFKAYPNMPYVEADVTKHPTISGLFANNEKNWPTAYVVAPTRRDATSVMGHELQHYIQREEGFSPGGNASYFAGQIEKGMRNNPDKFRNYDVNAVKDEAHNIYRKLAGEVEARNVEKRLLMTPQERRNIPPWYTQDVPFDQQLLFDPIAETVRALRRK